MVLIGSVILGSWLGMQAVHESGHALGALLTGGRVARMVLNPWALSRTDFSENPHPLFVVWAGPIFGVLLPLLIWIIAAGLRIPGAFILRFFAGFCLIANGCYIAAGSLAGIGDSGVMLRHGSAMWQLWLFGVLTAPAGLWLWHGQSAHFGLGAQAKEISPGVAYTSLVICLGLLGVALEVGGK
jgi:hypothetical protein